MAGKSKLLDYEPISNPRRSNVTRDYTSEAESSRSFRADSETKFDSDGPDASAAPAKAVSAQPLEVLKRGHTLTFACLFLFTFLVFFRPYEFSPSLMWLSKGALITALATLIFYIPTQLGLENRITVRTREVNLILILLLLCLFSVPFALDKFRAWNGFIEYLKVVIIFLVIVNAVRTEKQLKALLFLVLIATCILSFSAINDYRTGNLELRGQRVKGAIGNLFDNPNDLALHLVSFFPIVIGLALGTKNRIAKAIYFGVALTILGGTVATFSRGGFLGLVFVIGTIVWRLGKRNRTLVVVAAGFLFMAFLVLAPGAYRQRVTTMGDPSAETRKGDLKRSVYLALRNPINGVGMDNFVLYSDRELATHNSYTQVASELGLPAAAVYVLFLVAAIRRLRRIPAPRDVDKRQRRIPYLAIGLEASLIGFMVTSFFASVAYLWYVYYLVGYAICVSRLWETSGLNQSENLPPPAIETGNPGRRLASGY